MQGSNGREFQGEDTTRTQAKTEPAKYTQKTEMRLERQGRALQAKY